MKRIVCVALCVIFIFCLSSCMKKYDIDSYGNQYNEGIEQGREDMFIALYNASSYKKILYSGDVWETQHFSLILSTQKSNDETHLKYNITLKDIKIDQCYEEDKMVFNIYSWNSGSYDVVLGYDNYYDFAILEHDYPLGGNTASGRTSLYDNTKKLIAIIVIDDCVYTAIYYT